MKFETNISSKLQKTQAVNSKILTTAPTAEPMIATTVPSLTSTSVLIAKTETTTKYHRAAIDGYVDMLCDASKRDSNYATGDCAGFTPTLLAAYHGHLEALRILVGKGGDPEKTTGDGSSALHLATARNHLNCVSFLVNFGVNMWALDNELHTAKDIAAIEQRREVLDYLDQVMAKQSALNTKNVQKLKEKAKVAAERRLKQMRKAQLKAIKQVEKDEKYLIKLSNNRRLLKAAHSISDIKLVGRSDAISFTPSDISSSSIQSRLSDQSSKRLSSSTLQDKFSSSSSCLTTNFINNKIYIDRLKNNCLNNTRYNQLNCAGQFRTSLAKQSKPNLTTTSNHSDESPYGSSLSSTSGYLSSCSTNITTRDKINYARPKYSDLVAVGNEQPKLYISSSSSSSSKSCKQRQNNEQQSVKSNSTIGTRLRGFGGVSRKVKLKRLLLINSGSNNDLTSNNNSVTAATSLSDEAKFENRSPNNSSSSNNLETDSSFGSEKINKLCNVQPAIKLKLSSVDSHHSRQQNNNQPELSCGVSSIKWPPAPAMTRAISEPDLGSKSRIILDNEDEDPCDDDQSRKTDENFVDDRNVKNAAQDGMADEADQKDKEETPHEVTKPNGYSENPVSQRGNGICSEQTQHHLLTKCLSQLKMRHQESMNKLRQEFNANFGADKVRQNEQLEQFGEDGNTTSKLLQHQIDAGKVIIKPSLIKQQQQQQRQHLQSQIPNSHQMGPRGITLKQQYQFPASKETTISIDSIGSASSLVKRNQSSSSSKSDNSSSSATSSISYSSSYASSFEVSRPSIVVNTVESARTVQAGIEQQKQQHHVASKGSPTTMIQYKEQVDHSPNSTKETISTFLLSNGLPDLSEVFAKEKIDLEALMLLSEEDLKSLDILLGPRRKLLKAIEDRRRGSKIGSMYIMVDTQL